jgi:hypothetical protein
MPPTLGQVVSEVVIDPWFPFGWQGTESGNDPSFRHAIVRIKSKLHRPSEIYRYSLCRPTPGLSRAVHRVGSRPLILIEASPSAYLNGMLALGRTLTHDRGGDLRRFYAKQHPFYCGIDLHARSMYVCIVNQDGEVLLHRNMKAAPDPFLKAIAPYREGLVVAVECMFTWYWLADLCAQEGIAFVLGHAL